MPYKDPAKRKAYNRRYNPQHYASNRQMYLDKAKRRREKIKRQYEEYKKGLVCTDCGFEGHRNVWAIEFDHIDRNTKERTVSRMVSDGIAWKRILAEIKKCEPVCSNCHRARERRRMDEMGKEAYRQPSPSESALHDNRRRRRNADKQRQRNRIKFGRVKDDEEE